MLSLFIFKLFKNLLVISFEVVLSLIACKAPLSKIALLNKPFANGLIKRAPIHLAPADSPITVTLFLSPPKNSIFCFIHFKASIISNIPLFPEFLYSSPNTSSKSKKPNTPSL